MPRPPRRRFPAAVAVAVSLTAAVALAACGGGSSDNGALGGQLPASSTQAPVTYPPVPVNVVSLDNVTYPQVTSTPEAAALNALLLADGRALRARKVACNVSALRADTVLVSFRWTCADQTGRNATLATRSGRPVGLDDLFKPGYLPKLSVTAVTQLVASGTPQAAAARAAAPTPAAFANWAIDSDSLQVTFAVGRSPVTISFPLASLGSLLSPTGPLGQQATA